MKTKSAFYFSKVGNFLRNPEKVVSIMVALIMVLFMIKCISVALTSAFSFDGAIFAQISQNLAKNLIYATSYQGKLFDPIITTGIPVTLPIAISFRLFGESFASGLIVNAIYLVLLGFAIIYYLKVCLKLNIFLILMGIIMLLGTPDLFVNGFGLYGEVPALFYFMVAVIFLHKHDSAARPKFLFWAGLFLGLSYLTKTIILICVPALLLVTVFDFIVKRRLTLKMRTGVKRFFHEYIMLPIGFLAPVIFFELYRLISLGISAYLQWWKSQWTTVLVRAGVRQGFSDTNGILARILNRLDKLSTFIGINKIIIVLLLAVLLLSFIAILFYAIYHFLTKPNAGLGEKILISNDVLIMITVTLSYFGWWFILVPEQTVWYRYIFIGYMLMEFCLVMIVAEFTQYDKVLVLKARKVPLLLNRLIIVGWISLMLIGSGLIIIRSKAYLISFSDSSEKKGYLEEGQFIRNLPKSAEIFGYGYWQAPVVAFTSGRTFDNLLDKSEVKSTGSLNEKYFVVDFYAYYLDDGAYQNLLGQYDSQLVFSMGKNYIYKLKSRPLFAYEEFSDLEKARVSYSKIDFTKDNLDVFVRNVYVNEKNNFGKWAQQTSGYLFKYNHESKIKINLWFSNLEKYDQKPLELRVYANRMLFYYYPIDHDGSHELIIPLKNINGDNLEITILCNSHITVEVDSREPAFFITDMELIK